MQLQEKPKHGLDKARQALQQAVELDRGPPAAAIDIESEMYEANRDELKAGNRLRARLTRGAVLDGAGRPSLGPPHWRQG
ncbi:MAG TPA: hypothetical protein VFA26_20890, partial [Gemmataceae bacterium]|nr:hypothetical protein [Gemmataceae bacterium]